MELIMIHRPAGPAGIEGTAGRYLDSLLRRHVTLERSWLAGSMKRGMRPVTYLEAADGSQIGYAASTPSGLVGNLPALALLIRIATRAPLRRLLVIFLPSGASFPSRWRGSRMRSIMVTGASRT